MLKLHTAVPNFTDENIHCFYLEIKKKKKNSLNPLRIILAASYNLNREQVFQLIRK